MSLVVVVVVVFIVKSKECAFIVVMILQMPREDNFAVVVFEPDIDGEDETVEIVSSLWIEREDVSRHIY